MTVYVITGNKLDYPLPESYRPLLVGANFNPVPVGYLADNVGDNISEKNHEYCELTGLYWLWHHSSDNFIGLSHYRRYFANYQNRKQMDFHIMISGKVHPASDDALQNQLSNFDWIVAQPLKLDAESNWRFYQEFHHIEDLQKTREIIKEDFPPYVVAFDHFMHHSNRLSPYNMFYTTRDNLNSYCKWLFHILHRLEEQTDLSGYDQYQRRLYGFIAERLLNVWLQAHDNLRVNYLPVFKTTEVNRRHVLKLIKEKF